MGQDRANIVEVVMEVVGNLPGDVAYRERTHGRMLEHDVTPLPDHQPRLPPIAGCAGQ
jgi:hypothetical protein